MSPLPDHATLVAHYTQMVLLRRFELAAQEQYKKGRMPGFIHLYVGQEAVAVGVCAHLRRSDWITSTHRGHGHALAKGVSPRIVMAELYGKSTGCCGGRGGSMHLYQASDGLFGTNGFVGGGIPASVGLGFSARVRQTDDLAVAFFGDGAVNHGAFHESLNLAAVQNLPVIFICENNLYATATPLAAASRVTDIAERAKAYGVPGHAVDGNDVLAVWETMREATAQVRAGRGPVLIEARTYRTVGHHEGDPLVGTYRQQEELDAWKERCPIRRLRAWLIEQKISTAQHLDGIDARVAAQILDAVDFAEASPLPEPASAHEHVWADPISESAVPEAQTVEQTWLDAVRDGIAEEMRRNPHILYLGEGIGERGGSFAHTKGLWQEFGAVRVVDTPISELGFTGAGLGAAASGCPAVADLMFTDFLFEAASQIIQQAGKLRYMSNGKISVPLIVRSGMGAIKNAGPHHSGAYYPIWAHCPGLIVAVPSNPADAKGLFKTALRSGDPVIMLEHKMLFATKGQVPLGEHLVPFGRAAIVRAGKDLTLVACGIMVHRCLEAAVVLEKEGIACEVIDLRTIVPLDVETIAASVDRTHRCLVVDEAFAMCGLGAEVAAVLMEHAFDALDAPVGRLHTDPVAQPFSPPLENEIIVTVEKIVVAARGIVAGRAPIQRRAKAVGRAASAAPMVEHRAPAPAATAPAVKNTIANGVPIVMPNQDLTVTEGVVMRWLKALGERVALGEGVVEVETSKTLVEIESPAAGVLASQDEPAGKTILLGTPLGHIVPD